MFTPKPLETFVDILYIYIYIYLIINNTKQNLSIYIYISIISKTKTLSAIYFYENGFRLKDETNNNVFRTNLIGFTNLRVLNCLL